MYIYANSNSSAELVFSLFCVYLRGGQLSSIEHISFHFHFHSPFNTQSVVYGQLYHVSVGGAFCMSVASSSLKYGISIWRRKQSHDFRFYYKLECQSVSEREKKLRIVCFCFSCFFCTGADHIHGMMFKKHREKADND